MGSPRARLLTGLMFAVAERLRTGAEMVRPATDVLDPFRFAHANGPARFVGVAGSAGTGGTLPARGGEPREAESVAERARRARGGCSCAGAWPLPLSCFSFPRAVSPEGRTGVACGVGCASTSAASASRLGSPGAAARAAAVCERARGRTAGGVARASASASVASGEPGIGSSGGAAPARWRDGSEDEWRLLGRAGADDVEAGRLMPVDCGRGLALGVSEDGTQPNMSVAPSAAVCVGAEGAETPALAPFRSDHEWRRPAAEFCGIGG
jgi:hypothetical protein